MAPTGDEAFRWSDCVGAYGAPDWGVIDPTTPAARFLVDGGVPYLEAEEDGSLVRHRLVEVEPDVFLADNGETLDLAGTIPTWRGLRLVRVSGGPASWQWAILVLAAVLAATWLAAPAARALRRSRSRSHSPTDPSAKPGWRRITPVVVGLAAVLSLANVALLVWMPGLVDSGFVGWLDLPPAERLAFHLPLALAIAAAGTVVLAAAGWVGRWWSSAVRMQHAALAMATVALVVQLAVWRLIGLDLS